ncbi:SdiA-regulated domain-containing protein [Pseudomonas indica]|uniref:SdiA-regulated domain-containing protein n=1 Tax=Pseudomonas indica TaxID=137658 RepID=UPI000BABF460|nr:SdiA-regulated domain-containing protein [Pseudomonas indica]PAU55113.1 DNA-binding protein [Pseudomonas indica]
MLRSLAPLPFRPLWLLLAGVLVVSATLVNYLHWDDRLYYWFKERHLTKGEREANIWLPGYYAALQGKPLAGLENDETSGLTFNPATRTLFTVTGKHPLLVELSLEGEVLRRIELRGFSNPEGVEALGDGRLAIIDERKRQLAAFWLSETDQSIDLRRLEAFDLGFAEAGNKGFEGIGWDARHQRLLLAKERSPLGLFSLPFPGEDGAPGKLEPLSPDDLFVRDLSSVTVDPRTGHILVLSDESRLLLELDGDGKPISFISLIGGFNGLDEGIQQAEGVTMDDDGNIYVVGEPNLFYVFRKDTREPDPWQLGRL